MPHPSGVPLPAACVRQELAPLALDAYPEAYQEFRRVMMLFVYGPGSADSPVSDLWSVRRREPAAAQLARTIRQLKGAPPATVHRQLTAVCCHHAMMCG